MPPASDILARDAGARAAADDRLAGSDLGLQSGQDIGALRHGDGFRREARLTASSRRLNT